MAQTKTKPEHRFHDEGDMYTCGTCLRSWCGLCEPTPAARCPFEYEHEEAEESATITNDERVTYTLGTVRRWLGNYRINGARLAADGHTDRARVCEEHAQNLADIVAMLDGTDDEYIASVQER